jgi:hypothetical protein
MAGQLITTSKRHIVWYLEMMLGRLLLKITVFEGGAFSYNTVAGLQLAMDLLEEKEIPTNKFYDYDKAELCS